MNPINDLSQIVANTAGASNEQLQSVKITSRLAEAVNAALNEHDIDASVQGFSYIGTPDTTTLVEDVRKNLNHANDREPKTIDLSNPGDREWHLDDWLNNERELVVKFTEGMREFGGTDPKDVTSLWVSSDDIPDARSEWANQVLVINFPDSKKLLVLSFMYES